MRKAITILLIFIGGSAMVLSLNKKIDSQQKLRDVGVAGSFYPEDPQELTTMVDKLLANAKPGTDNRDIIGFIAPHAGYVYSGPVAAETYIRLKDRDINRVVIIAPSHMESFNGAAIYDGDAYQTPLGPVYVDREFAQNLSSADPQLHMSGKGHDTRRNGRMEHAIEVQLPFLQRTLTHFKIVPVIMGDQSYATCRALGRALAELIRDKKTVIIASSDLSHFHDWQQANELDNKVITAIREWDYFNLSRNLNSRYWEACGGGPIVAMMIAVEQLGANRVNILRQANSGDIPGGDKSRVVGYVAAALYADPEWSATEQTFSLSPDRQKYLLDIARQSVENAVSNGEIFISSDGDFSDLAAERGAFVTLEKAGRLRGCIGYTSPVKPLHETVRDAAVSAALKDPRFPAISAMELADITYEISVLSPFRRVTNINQIRVGLHGLLIKQGDREGLLLPQVAQEYNWDQETFLAQTCRKAGLPEQAWRDSATDIFMFSAFVFGEK